MIRFNKYRRSGKMIGINKMSTIIDFSRNRRYKYSDPDDFDEIFQELLDLRKQTISKR